MGRVHSRAWAQLRSLEDEAAAAPALSAVCGRDLARAEAVAQRFGWGRVYEDWSALVDAPDVTVFDNTGPNDLHAAPTIAAARAGKHVICEKPLGRNASEALLMLAEARQAGVTHMCAFNYRFFPAVRLARQVLEAGELGEIYQFRSRFLLGTGAPGGGEETSWRLRSESAGSGVVGDLLAHHIDLARYLVGEPAAVTAATRTWDAARAGVEVDVEDSVVAAVEFSGGAIGALEASRVTPGHTLTSVIEIDGSRGSVRFAVERPNELVRGSANGLTTISVTDPSDPLMHLWWPRGHGIGWADSFAHEARHFVGACLGAWSVEPHGATFDDGYRCARVCDAILEAAREGTRVQITKGEAAS